TDPAMTKKQIGRALEDMGIRQLSPEERSGFAQGAAALLAQVASRPNSPYVADIPAVEPLLAQALVGPVTPQSAAVALGDVPGVEAQRSLAASLLDMSRPPAVRHEAGRSLARSIQRFGRLVTADQEARLATALDNET